MSVWNERSNTGRTARGELDADTASGHHQSAIVPTRGWTTVSVTDGRWGAKLERFVQVIVARIELANDSNLREFASIANIVHEEFV